MARGKILSSDVVGKLGGVRLINFNGAPAVSRKLPRKFYVPYPKKISDDPAQREAEFERRLSEVWAWCLDQNQRADQNDCKAAFKTLAVAALPFLSDKRGRFRQVDSGRAISQRIELLLDSRRVAECRGFLKIDQVANFLTQSHHRKLLPAAFHKAGRQTIRKAIAQAFRDEQAERIVGSVDISKWQNSVAYQIKGSSLRAGKK